MAITTRTARAVTVLTGVSHRTASNALRGSNYYTIRNALEDLAPDSAAVRDALHALTSTTPSNAVPALVAALLNAAGQPTVHTPQGVTHHLRVGNPSVDIFLDPSNLTNPTELIVADETGGTPVSVPIPTGQQDPLSAARHITTGILDLVDLWAETA